MVSNKAKDQKLAHTQYTCWYWQSSQSPDRQWCKWWSFI